MRILVTGGCGFIGSNFIRYILQHYNPTSMTNVDVLTYAGNLANLDGVAEEYGDRYEFYQSRHRQPGADGCAYGASRLLRRGKFRRRIARRPQHRFAAELHPHQRRRHERAPRLRAAARRPALRAGLDRRSLRLVRRNREIHRAIAARPSSPYSASKAGADLVALAHHRTFGQEVIVTRCSNNYGPYQFPEKLIPLMIIKAMRDEQLPVYGDGMNVRDWIHVEDHCAAVVAALFEGKPGTVYNFGGNNEMPNIEVVKLILDRLEKPHSLISYVTDRLGHDRRYAIDSSFAQRELGWKPLHNFREGLESTIDWYLNNRGWWEALLERAGRY